MSKVEHPKYQIISNNGNFQIREYSPMIIAEVELQAVRKQAISEGFKLLAAYIFGDNIKQEKIPMTAPVQQNSSEKIPMTAPVQQQKEGESWKVSFVMPSRHSMNSLPKPNDNRVQLKEVPSQKFIVIQFSGLNSQSNIDTHQSHLIKHIQENKIKIIGSPKYAFYNPPWTLPFLRRNEIMLEIAD